MKKIHIILFVMATLILSACGNSTSQNNDSRQVTTAMQQSPEIFPKGKEINNDYFSGTAWLQMLVMDKDNFDTTVGNVIFEPGVRNNWHYHPGGQILLCIRGIGYYQEQGKAIQILNVGDVVEIRPNIIHWHGAAPDSEFEHIAISSQLHKGGVVWMQPVTDEEYTLNIH